MDSNNSRILFILHVPPPVHGSSMVGKYIKDSKLLNDAFSCRYINLGTSRSIDEIGKGGIKKLIKYLQIISTVILSLIKFKPQLCYLAISAKGGAFFKDALVALLIKYLGFNIVYHFHNKGVMTRQDKWLDSLLYKLVFRNSNVILLSKHLYIDIQKYVPEDRVSYCPNGIPQNGLVKPKKISNIPQIEILFLSNLIQSKGVFVLLEACKMLKEKKISFHCTYVGGEGDINEKEFNLKVADLNLHNFVHYIGKKYGKEKEEYFAKTDIFAFPTFNETFGLVNLEAMQYSLPIVSTYEGGIPDVVEDGKTGFLVPQKDAKALADKLELLIKDPMLRKKMGRTGRLKYEAEFTLDIFESRLKSILEHVVS